MKKVKWVLLAMVLCLGLIGGAYAAWTDFVTLDGTASTGNMEVIFSTNTSVDDNSDYNSISHSLSSDKKVLYVTMTDLFPQKDPANDTELEDDYATLNAVFYNDGTVPVILTGVDVQRVSGSSAVYNLLKINFKDTSWGPYTTLLKDFNVVSPQEGEIIEPGERSTDTEIDDYLTWRIWLDESAGNNTQNISDVVFKVTFHFEQGNIYDFQ